MGWIYKTEFLGTVAPEPARSSLHVQPDGVGKVEKFPIRKLSCSKNGAGLEKYQVWIME